MEKINGINFYEKLQDKKSMPLQEKIKKFIFEEFPILASQMDKQSLGEKFQTFITKLITEFCQIWKIKLTYQSEQLYQELCDNFENMLTKKLYNKYLISKFI